MKKIRILRNVPADPKRADSVAYAERQIVTVDDATAAKLLGRAKPLAVLLEDVRPTKPSELAAELASPKPIEPAKPTAKPAKQ